MKITRVFIIGCAWVLFGTILCMKCQGVVIASAPARTHGNMNMIEMAINIYTIKHYGIYGWPLKYMDEVIRKAKETPAVVRLETNAVQGATAETAKPPAAVEKTQTNRVSVTPSSYSYGYDLTDPALQLIIPLILGAIAVGVMVVWQCFRVGKTKSGIKGITKFIIKCIVVFGAIILLYIAVISAIYTCYIWEYKRRYPRVPSVSPIDLQMTTLRLAIVTYRAQEGKFPDSLDVLVKPIGKKAYTLKEEDIRDPWGKTFSYEYEGDNFVIWSSGPDKKMWTADDVIGGAHQPYVEIWRAKLKQAVAEQETNATQEATTGTTQQPAGIGKTPSNLVPVTGGQSPTESAETKSAPWKIPLLIGVFIFGCVTAWCYFRNKQKGKTR